MDDTLTHSGKLPVDTLSALVELQTAGITVVPVTGGCSGWCDCMLRTWPIQTIIGENGAVWMWLDNEGKLKRQFLQGEEQRKANIQELETIKERVLLEVPATGISLDTDFRLTDIAFDIGQQLKLEQNDIDKILSISREMGANAKASTIHVNVWFGEISKAIGASEVLKHLHIDSEEAIFIGDSPNDESMFEQFEVTVGVHNIVKFLPALSASPNYITAQSGGFGFVELAQALLAAC